MARINVAVNPMYLSDQHLVAESVEITMITGGLRMHNYKIKGEVPARFPMGKGHINFFKNKLLYLSTRLTEVNTEMIRRGFKPGTHINLAEFPEELHGAWNPDWTDTRLIRDRVVDRLRNPKSGKVGKDYHRHYGVVLGEKMDKFCDDLWHSELFYV
jgi:hypothetical protein